MDYFYAHKIHFLISFEFFLNISPIVQGKTSEYS